MEPKVFDLVPGSAASTWALVAALLLTAGLALLFGWIAYGMHHGTVELSPEGLRLHGGFYAKHVAMASIVREGARIVDLKTDADHRPRMRTNGIGLPGYTAGWVRLNDGEKALVFLTDRKRVVYVPTHDGYALLMSVKDPEAFLTTLKGT